jgi:hypothetical protein
MRVSIAAFTLLTVASKLALAQGPSPTRVAAADTASSTAATAPADSAPATTTTTETHAHVFEGETPHPTGLTAWAGLPWGGWGIGGRYMMPLAIGSLLNSPAVRDTWALEFGMDYLRLGDSVGPYDFHYNEILPVVGIMWDFWFSPNFAIYPKAELGYAFAWFSGDNTYGSGYGGLFASGAGGALYKLGNGLTLRAEVGISGLKGGVAWLF